MKAINFTAQQVTAYQAGTLKQVRVEVKPQPPSDDYQCATLLDSTGKEASKHIGECFWSHKTNRALDQDVFFKSPYQPGDVLPLPGNPTVTGVRVERVREISDNDCLAMGIYNVGKSGFGSKLYSVNPDAKAENHYEANEGTYDTPGMCFACLWDSRHGKGAWDRNGWEWVIDIEKGE